MAETWTSIALEQILIRSNDWIDIEPCQVYKQVTVKMWGKGIELRNEILGSEIAASKRLKVHPKQFILSRIDARHGAFGLIPDELEGAVVTNDFPVFNLNQELLLPEFLNWLSKTAGFVDICRAASEGTTNRIRLKEDRFLKTEIILPPIAEQRRIVARIEEVAAKIEEARGLRKRAIDLIEIVFISVLKKIREEISSNYQKQRISTLTQVSSGGTPSRNNPDFWNGSIPWIKTGELLDGDIYGAEEYITSSALSNTGAKLFPKNTILIAMYGQGQTRGRTGRLMIEAATNQACAAILPKPSLIEPRFLQYWLRSLYFEMREQYRDGAQPNWNGRMIKDIEIALPPISEQQQVIKHLDNFQKTLKRIQNQREDALKEFDALLPAILDKAFKGEL